MSEDRELVARAIAREPGAFAALVERHQKLVWHLVYRMVRHPDDTRDLSQEVFLKVHQRLHQFRFESALSTWIGRIAFSVAARHLERKRIPIVEMTDDDESGDAPLDRLGSDFDLEAACANDDLQRQLRQALDDMPPLQRTLLTLYHLDELGVAEIAQVTGLPAGTVKNYLFRARRQLRNRFVTLTGESR